MSANLNNEPESRISGVYESSEGRFSTSTFAITEKPKCIKNMTYKWAISYKKTEVDGIRTLTVTVKMESRYIFNDKVVLQIQVKNEGTMVTLEKVDLQKIFENQIFQCDCTEIITEDCWSDAKISAKFLVCPNNYYTCRWATPAFFRDENRPHDTVVIIGMQRFYIHKVYLSTWSRYFDRMFYGEFKEKNQYEIEIEEVDPEDFHKLLQFIHPDLYTKVKDDNVLILLKLADRFEIPSVMAECGTHLKDFENCPEMTLMDRLELADKHSLVHLQIACFQRIHCMLPDDFKEFHEENWRRLRELSPNTQKNIM